MFVSKRCLLGGVLIAVVAVLIQLVLPADCYYNETKFKKLVYHDHTNDDAISMSTEELITRSGFDYKDYYAVADDGYITQILHLINPKADKKQLKYPPVLILHGSHLDTSIYVMASSIQHHPERWPRKPIDGPMTSYNRSLAFTLANNGYDVWLLGGRGSNLANSAWTKEAKLHRSQQPHFKPSKWMKAYSWLPKYWNSGLDDIIKYELYNQIDLVRNLTGAKEIHYFSFSLTTMTTMALLAKKPSYAKMCRTYTQMAPVIAASHFSHLARIYWEKIVPYVTNRGIGHSPSYFFDQVILKKVVFKLAKSDFLRYTAVQELNRMLFGPSPIYHTNLERNVIHHLIQPVSFKSAQHYGQVSKTQKFRHYDYGPLGNLFHYNKTSPPEYKIDRLEVQNYLIISAALDALADSLTVQRIKEQTSTPTPVTHMIAPGFNHIDLVAAVEVDIYVNKPIIEYLDKHSDWPGANSSQKQAPAAGTPRPMASTAQ
uniref:Gastric triacylglycerol lipase n=1 Tax=Aceria tosichella TaxID=561515 RepID=A0A6G1S7R7_9ACAR